MVLCQYKSSWRSRQSMDSVCLPFSIEMSVEADSLLRIALRMTNQHMRHHQETLLPKHPRLLLLPMINLVEHPNLIINLPLLSPRVFSKLLISQPPNLLLRDHKVSRRRSEALEDSFPSLVETINLRAISRPTVKLIPSSSNMEHTRSNNMGMLNSPCTSNSLCISNSPCMLNGLRGQGWVLAEP